MVCLRIVGGGLNSDTQTRLDEAARVHANGKLDAATALYHEVLGLEPHEPNALQMLGVIAQQKGESELALRFFNAALTAKPDFLQARFNLSVVLRVVGRNDEALEALHKTLEAAPTFAEAWDLAGQLFNDKGAFADAHKCFAHALGLQPNNAHFYGNYALLLFAQGDLSEAYKAARKAESLDPTYPSILLGNILRAWGYPEEAAECFARARKSLPNFADACTSEAMARLQMGEMEQGLALWEHRPDFSSSLYAAPLWQGQKVASLLLYEDQGLGDALQFMRYIPLLGTRVGHLILRVREPLRTLCITNFPDIDVLADTDTAAPTTDARCRLSSLPFLFATRLSNIPPAPYLTAPDSAVWRERMRGLPTPRIGLVWAGNVNFHNNAARSLDFCALAPVLSCGAEHFVSIQKDCSNDLATAGIYDAAPLLHNFADTAALIAELDLVISVDTATAHLAGALGKPVFLLVPFASDWRWLLGREDSPWYSTMRLFRQRKAGDWNSVIETLGCEVKKFISGDTSVLCAEKWTGENLRKNPNALPL